MDIDPLNDQEMLNDAFSTFSVARRTLGDLLLQHLAVIDPLIVQTRPGLFDSMQTFFARLPDFDALHRHRIGSHRAVVYFIWDAGGTLLYVGQTNSILSPRIGRFARMRGEWSVTLLSVPSGYVNEIEAFYIRTLHPSMNTVGRVAQEDDA
jgi:hypothetical protein